MLDFFFILLTLLDFVSPIEPPQLTLNQKFEKYKDDRVLYEFYRESPRTSVGYAPVITVLPDGTNMRGMAIISADRRYVRINTQPVFSGITNVDTFSFQRRVP